MECLHSLPHELVLLVAEHAAWSCVRERAGWVASLCLVSRSFRTTVTPILYGLVTVYKMKSVLTTAALMRFAHTHTIFFSVHTSPIGAANWGADLDYVSLARALANLRAFTGSSENLEMLAYFNPGLWLSSAFITDSANYWASSARPCMRAALRHVARLHVVVDIVDATFAAMQAPFVVVDALVERDELEDEHVAAFLRAAERMLASASMQRVILRPRCLQEEVARGFARLITAWAEAKRDPRIWLDDAFVSLFGANGDFIYDAHDLADTLAGDNLWETGRQVYRP